MIEPVQAQGLLRWPGFVPNDQAMPVGKAPGLPSLLQDGPNFLIDTAHQGGGVHGPRRARGDHAAARYECGFVVPFGNSRAAAQAGLVSVGLAA